MELAAREGKLTEVLPMPRTIPDAARESEAYLYVLHRPGPTVAVQDALDRKAG